MRAGDLHREANVSETRTATHTPGPWRVAAPPPKGTNPIADALGDERSYAVDIGRNHVPWLSLHDALLIAAAPDLLAACEQLIDADATGDAETMADAIESARKALVKVEGYA